MSNAVTLNAPEFIDANHLDGAQQFMGFRDVVLFIKRNLGIIIAVTVLSLILAVAYISSTTPLYTAVTTMELNVKPNKALDFESAVSSLNYDPDAEITSELDIMLSRPISERIIKKFGLDQDMEFNTKQALFENPFKDLFPSTPQNASDAKKEAAPGKSAEDDKIQQQYKILDRFQGRLAAKRKPKSYIVEISFTSRSPEKARQIADAVAETYIASQIENKFSALQQANDFLSKRLNDLQKGLTESERKVQEFREQHNLVETGAGGITVTEQQLSELNSQLILARAAQAQAEAKLTNANVAADATPEVLNSNLIQALRTQEAEVLRKKADLSNRYGPKHPAMINVTAEVADLENKIQAEINKILKSLENDVTIAKDREATLEENLQSLQKKGETGEGSVELAELVREANANKSLYESFLARYKQTSEGTNVEEANARIVSRAEIPSKPAFPRTMVILPVSAVMGIILGTIVASALEALDITFKNSRALEHATRLRVAGMLPELRRKAERDDPVSMIVYYEALKSAFVSMTLMKGHVPKVMLVTSSSPEEGKSYFAISFAKMLARSGKKVLLVDTDLKRAELTRDLVKEKSGYTSGFNDLMKHRGAPEAMIMKGIEPNMDFMPCKPSTINSQDLLSSKAMEELVVWLRSSYDHVIFDTPPILAVADAILVSKMTDMCLFIVRWGKTPRQMVKAAMKAIVPTGATIALLITRTHIHRLKAYDTGEAAYYYNENRNY